MVNGYWLYTMELVMRKYKQSVSDIRGDFSEMIYFILCC